MTRELDRADELFVADMTMAETLPSADLFGIVEIARFLKDPASELTPAQTRRLFADAGLRGAYRDLKTKLEYASVPEVRAASDGEIDERVFPQGRMRIVPARDSMQVYLRLTFLDPDPSVATMLIVEMPEGGLLKRALPPQDQNGEIVAILNLGNPRDAALIKALRDPSASGSILALSQPDPA